MQIDSGFWVGKRVFITGGTGFIGGHLVKKLLSLGAIVRQFVHHVPPSISQTTGYTGDITCWVEHLQKYLSDFKPEVVFHLAAQPIVGIAMKNEYETLDVNIKGTYNLLHVCKNLDGLECIIQVTTDKVFGKIETIQDDSIPVGVEHPYNASKVCADVIGQMYAHSYDMPITIIRNGNIYGPRDLHWDRIIPGTIKRVFENISPILRGNALRDYIYVDDIVIGYLKAVEVKNNRKELETFNLGSACPTHTSEVIDLILKKMNRVDVCPTFEPMWKGELPNQHIIDTKATEILGWNPQVSLEEGISRTVDWYCAYLSYLKIKDTI